MKKLALLLAFVCSLALADGPWTLTKETLAGNYEVSSEFFPGGTANFNIEANGNFTLTASNEGQDYECNGTTILFSNNLIVRLYCGEDRFAKTVNLTHLTNTDEFDIEIEIMSGFTAPVHFQRIQAQP